MLEQSALAITALMGSYAAMIFIYVPCQHMLKRYIPYSAILCSFAGFAGAIGFYLHLVEWLCSV